VEKGPVFKLTIQLAVAIVIFYALSLLPVWNLTCSWLVRVDARFSAALLSALGEQCNVSGASIFKAGCGITVEPNCSAIEFIVFYFAAVFSFPAPLLRKILGLFLGGSCIFGLNLLRIASLYWIESHLPAFFDVAHMRAWPSVLVIVTLLLFIAWIQWSVKPNEAILS
jgi:exosortase/archaeosortase family protein